MPLVFPRSITTIGGRAAALANRVSAAAIQRGSESVFEATQARWPVGPERGRPHSRDLLSVTQGQSKGRHPIAIIRGKASYTLKIVSKGVHPWDAFVLTPAWAIVRALPRAIAQGIADELLRGRSG